MLYIVGLLTDCNTQHPLRNGPTFEKYLSGSSFVLCGVLNVKKVNWSREKSSDDYNDMKLEFLKSKKMIWNIVLQFLAYLIELCRLVDQWQSIGLDLSWLNAK